MVFDGPSPWSPVVRTLTIAGIILTGLGAPLPNPNLRTTPPRSEGLRAQSIDSLRAVSRHIFRLTNQKRAQRGLDSLTKEGTLRRIACEHSRDMIDRDFVRHENPDGDSPADRVAKQHRRLIGGVGENLWSRAGRATVKPTALAEEIVNRWMKSPPHRKNLLWRQFSHLGVCTLQRGERIRGTQVFALARAYFQNPLPSSASAGDTIVAPIERTVPRDAVIAKYDFWDPATKKKATSPVLFADTLKLPETPGAYRLRVYVPDANRYQIHFGPQIRVMASPESDD